MPCPQAMVGSRGFDLNLSNIQTKSANRTLEHEIRRLVLDRTKTLPVRDQRLTSLADSVNKRVASPIDIFAIAFWSAMFSPNFA